MPIPVSLTSKAIHRVRPARRMRNDTPPRSVNLSAFDRRFLSTCWSRVASVDIVAGSRRRRSPRAHPLVPRHRSKDVGELVRQPPDRDLLGADIQLPRFDLRQIEDVVDEDQEIIAGRINRFGKFDLLAVEVPLGIVGQHLGQDQRAVERRAQLVRHVGQELGLVGAGPLQFRLRARAEIVPLALQRLGLLFEIGVDLFQLGLLVLQPRLRVLQRVARLLELFILDPQLLLLRLQLLGLTLGLFQRIAQVRPVLGRPQGQADGLRQSAAELHVVREDRMKGPDLDGPVRHAVHRRRDDQQVPRRASSQPRADREEILRHVLGLHNLVALIGFLREPAGS